MYKKIPTNAIHNSPQMERITVYTFYHRMNDKLQWSYIINGIPHSKKNKLLPTHNIDRSHKHKGNQTRHKGVFTAQFYS